MTKVNFHTIELAGSFGVRDAPAVAARLLAALESEPAVTISTAALEAVDVSIVQVLVAAHKWAVRAGKPLTLDAPAGGVLRRTLAAVGLPGAAGSAAEAQFWGTGTGRSEGKAA